ncbi:hypothetical protein P175DRAFT_0502289 [Aspergillus ochraceoroseus IBT 24754]|uniref:Uncharacterized protein n=1 Tax=Aspergillus ochraceoroseus IBT 24754 TaxID=1392256 RepID=A0A2T5LV26_9EURO|nr:uncharacterized protein P175DRAFT_0502289 [Aspergillus ochraceoroseus IBT 24754]PTU20138.1 hypothetical protein P175DRAFT_0502289 [Aspergillus ochraceoroseus IBT 24754]
MPQDLLGQIKEFEEVFTVDAAKLKQIVAHFIKELEKGQSLIIPIFKTKTHHTLSLGLSVEGGNIVRL